MLGLQGEQAMTLTGPPEVEEKGRANGFRVAPALPFSDIRNCKEVDCS